MSKQKPSGGKKNMATATASRSTRVTKATKPRTTRTAKRRFDGDESDHWHTICSKGQMFALAIAAFNGATFPGSELLCDRDAAKEVITAAKEAGFLD